MKKLFLFLLIAAFVATAMVGCSKSSDDEATSDLTLSGTLSAKSAETRTVGVRAVQYELYKLYCVTFEEVPSAGAGDADSTGFFELKLEGAKDKPFGCFVQEKTTSKVVATLVFEDTSKDGLDGQNQQSGQISLTGSSGLGTIVLDFDKGVAVVNVANIQTAKDETKISEHWDFTGTWVMNNASSTPPTGYDLMPTCGSNVNGPCIDSSTGQGMSIYLKRLEAKDTTTGDPVFGMMVWQSETAFNTCGKKLGFSVADAVANAGVNFSDAVAAGDIGEGSFTWTATTACGSFLDGTGWKCSNAQARWDFYLPTNTTGTPDVAQGALCSSLADDTDAKKRLKLQCFAEAYWELVGSEDPAVCAQDIRFDWSATNADDFVKDNGPLRARTQYVFEKFVYTTEDSGSFTSRSEWGQGIQVSAMDWGYCKMVERMTMSFTKTTDTTAVGDMQIETKLIVDGSAAACATNSEVTERVGTSRYMLKLTKQ